MSTENIINNKKSKKILKCKVLKKPLCQRRINKSMKIANESSVIFTFVSVWKENDEDPHEQIFLPDIMAISFDQTYKKNDEINIDDWLKYY